MNRLHDFFSMGGYAFYVWTAYAGVLIFLLTQWLPPFKQWRRIRRKHHE